MRNLTCFLMLPIFASVCLGAEAINFDDAETGITSGFMVLEDVSGGTTGVTVTGSLTAPDGSPINYTASAMVTTNTTSYAATTITHVPDNANESRVRYDASGDRFTFQSGWGEGEGQTGEYREQMLTVVFGHSSLASDVSVNYSSLNSRGEAWESGAVQFLDVSGSPIGTVSYDGYWDMVGSAVNSDPIVTTGFVFTTEDTSTIDTTDSNNPVQASDASTDNGTVTATGVGISATTLLTGYKITRFLEDVATVDGRASTGTTTSTATIASVEGGMVSVPEPSSFLFLSMFGTVLCGVRKYGSPALKI